MSAVKKEKRIVPEMARQALAKTDSLQDAQAYLMRLAGSNDQLYRELTSGYLAQACYDALSGQIRQERSVIFHAVQPSNEEQRGRIVNLARTLLDFPLPGGMKLRDARRSDLIAAADFYRKQANDMAHKARWLYAIAESVGKKRVANALSESDIARLQKETA